MLYRTISRFSGNLRAFQGTTPLNFTETKGDKAIKTTRRNSINFPNLKVERSLSMSGVL